MTTNLYVTNLSTSATLATVRDFFSSCGAVTSVELVAGRNTRPTSAARVTMATEASATRAVDKLHGALLHKRTLMVTAAQATPEERKEKKRGETAPGVRILQQYRDRRGMSYELDAAGLRLTIKFAFLDSGEAIWQAHAAITNDTLVELEACAPSRELAFTALSEQCTQSPSSQLSKVRWLDVAAALRAVRAI